MIYANKVVSCWSIRDFVKLDVSDLWFACRCEVQTACMILHSVNTTILPNFT